MADADFSGVLNPKRVIRKREEMLENPAQPPQAMPAQATMSQTQFAKPFSPEERARQNAQLARLLAAQQGR